MTSISARTINFFIVAPPLYDHTNGIFSIAVNHSTAIFRKRYFGACRGVFEVVFTKISDQML
jgi:hypothetical protein